MDYTIKFNPDVSSITERTFSSQDNFDETSCIYTKTNNLPGHVSFTDNESSDSNAVLTNSLVGVAINGVPIMTGNSGDAVDPFYP
jgi:hypothetical protein